MDHVEPTSTRYVCDSKRRKEIDVSFAMPISGKTFHLESFGEKVLLFLSRYFFYVENLGFQSFTSLVADLRHERNRIFHITGPVYAKTYIYILGICL